MVFKNRDLRQKTASALKKQLTGEITFVWTGKGRKASESLYQPKNTELFWTIFYISSTISLQYDRKGPEFLKIYKVR